MNHCEGCSGLPVDEKVVEIAQRYSGIEGGIISALHEIQDNYGYISEAVQKYFSSEFDMPLSKIYGIITFYSRFSLKPKGKYNIQVCLGTACYVKGSQPVFEEFKKQLGIDEKEVTADGKFSLESVRCIGACGLAPAIVVNEDVYGKFETKRIGEIIEKYKNLDI